MEKFYEYMQKYDVATAFIDYLCRPAYQIAKGFADGFNYNDKEALEYLIKEDDLAYESGLLNYKKSAVELDKMLDPPAKRAPKRQPKVDLKYKEYCCD